MQLQLLQMNGFIRQMPNDFASMLTFKGNFFRAEPVGGFPCVVMPTDAGFPLSSPRPWRSQVSCVATKVKRQATIVSRQSLS